MTVRYYPGDKFFAFDSDKVPDGCLAVYSEDDDNFDMFMFLNTRLRPTNIDTVRIESDGTNGWLCVEYWLDEQMVRDLPPFTPSPVDYPF